jgi:hypothetical protein
LEARAEFRQPRISKGLVAIVAVSIALGLGVMAGTLSKAGNGTTTTVQHAALQGKGGSALQTVRHGGLQTVEENAPTSTAVGPDDRAGSPALAPIAGRGVSPDATDRKASQLPVGAIGSQLVPQGVSTSASDAANHLYQTWSASKPTMGFSPERGYREG